MTSKYYTPIIEEFHVGFLCESYITTNRGLGDITSDWQQIVFGNTNTQYESLVLGELIHKQELDLEKFRVKYLDKEDIESLGFVDVSLSTTSHEMNIYVIPNKVNIYHIPHLNKISITILDKLRTPYPDKKFKEKVIFEGIIKNKSELKVLLKQLSIND